MSLLGPLSPPLCARAGASMATAADDPPACMRDFLREHGGCAVIDGGLATELEANGADLNDPLWSAKCLLSSPHLIRKVHLDYPEAGADILITASYQATIQGFQSKGLSREQSEELLRKSVSIACEAREIFYNKLAKDTSSSSSMTVAPKRRSILIAASVGSYAGTMVRL